MYVVGNSELWESGVFLVMGSVNNEKWISKCLNMWKWKEKKNRLIFKIKGVMK